MQITIPKSKFILTVLFLSVLLFYTTFSNVDATHNHEDIVGWTWSQKISKGSTYYWNVTELSEDNIPITSISNNDLNIIQGSIISVTINDDLQNLDYLKIVTLTGGDIPMEIKVDGRIVKNPGRLAVEFIYPNMVIWRDGALTNLFYMDTPEYNDQLQFSPYASVVKDEYVINITQGNDQKIVERDIETGLLNTWHLQIQNSILTYDRLANYVGIFQESHRSTEVVNPNLLNSFITIYLVLMSLTWLSYSKNRFKLFS